MCLTKKQVLGLSATIFALVALVHAARLAMGWPVRVHVWDVPVWVSIVPTVVGGYLAYELWKLYNEREKKRK